MTTLTARPRNVIVEREATGHAHCLQVGPILKSPDGALYLDLAQTTPVVHEEHGPPGLWLVVRKPEYHLEAINTVMG